MYWKGIGVFGEDKGFHYVTHPSPSLQATLRSRGRKLEHQAKGLRLWYNLNSFIYDQRGRKHFEGSNDSVFGDSCQRGRKYEPKAKGPHHHQFQKLSFSKNIFQLVSHGVQKGEKVVFQKWYIKTLLNTKRRISFRGVLFSQRKSIWNRGRKFQILKMLRKILFIYLWLFAKELWKGFTK